MSKPIFRDLTGEDPDPETTEVESLCMNCHENGITRLLLTKIPFYKEVVLMSFSCEHCGFTNNEIQSGGEISPKGCRITFTVVEAADLNRRVVKSDYSSFKIIELDFEIPAQSQKGEVTTIEGIIERSISGLEQDQVLRRIQHPEEAEKIDKFIDSLKELKNMEKPFSIIIEDISGNSFIENPNAPHTDPKCRTTHFIRTKEQDHMLGIFEHEEIEDKAENEKDCTKNDGHLNRIAEGSWPLEELHGEVLQFATLCPNCGSDCETNMKMTSIPHFKDVVIMATVCDSCGNRTNEVKSGGGIEEKGTKIEVLVRGREDFSRDVLKSETCGLTIRELDCEVGAAALGGRFTTVEGVLLAMRDQISECSGGFFQDSQDLDGRERMSKFLAKLDDVLAGKLKVTLVLDDPTGNSYVQSLSDEGSTDEGIKIIRYHRSHEQNEELGLNDMKTENYEKDE